MPLPAIHPSNLKITVVLPARPRRYVYLRQYESGGQFWPYVAHKLVWCQMLMVVFTALVFLVKGAYTQAGVLAVTLPILLLNFKS